MTRTHLRERLAALHMPPPPILLGLSQVHAYRYRQLAMALYLLSQGHTFAVTAQASGITEFALATMAARAIELHESGRNGYLACVESTRRQSNRESWRFAMPARPSRHGRAGTRILLHAALEARVRCRVGPGDSPDRLEAHVLAELACEVRVLIRKVFDEQRVCRLNPRPSAQEVFHE